MGDIADSHLEDMELFECEYCGAIYPDECSPDCPMVDEEDPDDYYTDNGILNYDPDEGVE